MNPFADPLFVQAEMDYRRERALWTMRHLSEPGSGRRLLRSLSRRSRRRGGLRSQPAGLGCRATGRPAT